MNSPQKLTLVTAILSGGNREDLILDAALSTEDLTDTFLLINTGPSADKAIDLILSVYNRQVEVLEFPGTYSLCSEGRNLCLKEAETYGDWCLLLDTDERLHNTDGVLQFLEETKADVVMVPDQTGYYLKPKFFRLPAKGTWQGDPHEAWVMTPPGTEVRIPTKTYFSEVPKTKEEQDARMASIARQIEAKPGPLSPRELYYLADALNYLGQVDRAVELFLECNRTSTWDEEQHWSLFRAGLAELNRGNLRACVTILQTQEVYAIPELLWLRSLAEHRLGWQAAAVRDALDAYELGKFQRNLPRRGFRHTLAWYDGPLDVLRWAYKALGDAATANKYDTAYQQEKQLREAVSGN